MSEYDINRLTDLCVLMRSREEMSLIWHHYTHFEAQRVSRQMVMVDLLRDRFREECCAAESGVQVQVKKVGCSGFAFLR